MKKRIKKIKNRFFKLKISDKAISFTPLVFSIISMIISIITIYHQFFHINHELKYATLYPILNEEEKSLIFPILLKNTGNQTETIIDFELLLEAKNKNETFYKRISELNREEFFSILKPGESKKINLIGNYKIYLFGTIALEENDFMYQPISELDDLNLLLKTTFLTKKGVVATEDRIVGRVSFTENETIKRIDCPPTKLRTIELSKNQFEIFQYSIIPDNRSHVDLSIDFTDSASIIKNLNKLLFLEKVLQSDEEKNLETLKILKEVLKPYR